MFSWIFIFWFLQINKFVSAAIYNISSCYYKISEEFHREGDVVIGAFLPLHTFHTGKKKPHLTIPYYYLDNKIQYNFKNYQYILALQFAIEEINGNPNLLPNISLGFDFYNVRFTGKYILDITFNWLTALGDGNHIPNYNCKKRNFTAALTGTSWITSAQIGTLLQLFKFPQITFGPYDLLLSDRGQYPSLYQMAPKDTSLSLAIVSLMVHFRWSWVGLILPDDHKGNKILSDFREEMERKDICLAFVKMTSDAWTSYFYKFWENIDETNVTIIYGDIDSLEGVIRNIEQRLLTWNIWIMNIEHHVIDRADYFMLDSFHGSLIFKHHYRENFEFTKFIQRVNPNNYPEDIYLPKLWYLFFKCSFANINCHVLENCQTNASLDVFPRHIFDVAMNAESTSIYNGVYAVAHSLHEMRLQQLQMQPYENGKGMVFFPWQIPQSVCSESCGLGFRKVTMEGKAICCYKCTPCAVNEISNETDVDQCVKCPESHYANTEKSNCFQKSVSFLAYEDPLGTVLVSIALCLSTLTVFVIGIFVKHRETPIVKANNRALSYILLITLTFCFLCSLNFIGKPTTAACILQQTTFAVAFTVALATVLAKAITVVLAFKVSFPGRMVRWLMISRGPNYIIPICTLIQLFICGIWMATYPPFIDQDAHTEYGHIIILCNKGSAVAFHSVLGYLCFMALGSYAMAFLSRNLPDTFNESKFLSFSMLVFFCVWITFLPVYHSTKGKVMVAMEIFSILASSTALLAFIFGPKCYIILLRPDKNSLNHIRK
uniref:Vomeronasal 2, receptor 95 n=1 Tax=Mus spicilegus TaxID=10103 RepID=A0A8C6N4L0_MUSSI